MVEKRLLGEVIRAAGSGIQFSHFRVTDRGSQAQHRSEQNAYPHRGRGRAGSSLSGKGQPKKRPGSDERHGIHRQSGQT